MGHGMGRDGIYSFCYLLACFLFLLCVAFKRSTLPTYLSIYLLTYLPLLLTVLESEEALFLFLGFWLLAWSRVCDGGGGRLHHTLTDYLSFFSLDGLSIFPFYRHFFSRVLEVMGSDGEEEGKRKGKGRGEGGAFFPLHADFKKSVNALK